jgi:hypothetical protein
LTTRRRQRWKPKAAAARVLVAAAHGGKAALVGTSRGGDWLLIARAGLAHSVRARTTGARERDGLVGGGAGESGSGTSVAEGMTGGSPLSGTAVPRGRGKRASGLAGPAWQLGRRQGCWAAALDCAACAGWATTRGRAGCGGLLLRGPAGLKGWRAELEGRMGRG